MYFDNEHLKNWSSSDLIEEGERTAYKLGEVVQEMENLQSLLNGLRERQDAISDLLR